MDREKANEKLDTMFDQIDKLEGDDLGTAQCALMLWRTAKTAEFVGLGPMEAMPDYKAAYSHFNKLGLETSGMIQPYESPL